MEAKNIKGGRWKIFEPVNHNEIVVFGVDTASGKEGANESVITGVSVHTGIQKCILAGKYTPEEISIEVLKAGWAYYYQHKDNPAEIAIEREFHGATVISELIHHKYPAVYFHAYHIDTFNSGSNNFGWDARKYKQPAIDYLQKSIGWSISKNPEEKRRALYVKDPDTISQLGWYQRDKKTGKFGAMRGKYDDRVSALMIANWVRMERMARVFDPPVEEAQKEMSHADVIMAGVKKNDDRDAGPRELS